MQRYINYPKVGAKNSENLPKYHPKPKVKAKRVRFLPKYDPKPNNTADHWFSGTHNLTLATLCKISAALGEDIIKVTGHQYYPLCEEEALSVAEESLA